MVRAVVMLMENCEALIEVKVTAREKIIVGADSR